MLARAGADITVPPQVRQRLLQREYHPARFGRWLRAGLASAAVTVVAGVALAVIALLPAGHQARMRQARGYLSLRGMATGATVG